MRLVKHRRRITGKIRTRHRNLQSYRLRSRIGTILISAAVIDDVFGLVLASLIPTLADISNNDLVKTHTSLPWTIVRPILSSIMIALVTLITSRFILRPLFWYRGIGETWCAPRRQGQQWGFGRFRGLAGGRTDQDMIRYTRWGTRDDADAVQLVITVLTVSAFASVAFYTGSSVLFGAFVAGLVLSYTAQPPSPGSSCLTEDLVQYESRKDDMSFEKMYQRTIGPLQAYLFAPLFFASIGFSIPFRSLWRPTIVWRGVLYAVLMCIAKLTTGLPVLWWSIWKHSRGAPRSDRAPWHWFLRHRRVRRTRADTEPPHALQVISPTTSESRSPPSPTLLPTTAHLAPAVFMGVAMVSRGEIGLLVLQTAHASGSKLVSDDIFLISIWAILLCTLVGPIGVGLVVNRWSRLIQSGM
ncbi:hypothetical protein BDW22DRAFT_868459 [Trametopsis cervina]|nr:hypothetical protein BDW22DRAFT_868459 [Trametopsis cervina]